MRVSQSRSAGTKILSLAQKKGAPIHWKSLPPPTKWTISRWSPSCNWVLSHCARGTISRFSSTATRSPFIPSCSMNWDSEDGAAQYLGSPFTKSCMKEMYRKAQSDCRSSIEVNRPRFRPYIKSRPEGRPSLLKSTCLVRAACAAACPPGREPRLPASAACPAPESACHRLRRLSPV